MDKLNLGVIGLGFIGKVAAADSSKKALNYVREFGVKQLFIDYHELLKLKDLDV